MAHQFNLAAETRRDAGKGASRRLRREGKIPGIMYGGGQPPLGVAFDANALHRNMAEEAFLSSILNVTLDGQPLQAIVRDYQPHPSKRAILHLDLQRIVATEKLWMTVPLHFVNQDTAPGVKLGGGDFNVSYDWNAGELTLPLAFQVGKIQKIGRYHYNLSVEAEWTAVVPEDQVFPRWGIRLGVVMMIPE